MHRRELLCAVPAPSVTDEPPAELRAQLQALSDALDAVPAKAVGRNLLIGTWNLREFGRVTPKWRSGPRDIPKRDLFAIRVVSEVVSRFDVVAINGDPGTSPALNWLKNAFDC